MPKLKTNRGAAKRFKETGSGRFKHRRANRNHILTKKGPRRKGRLRANGMVDVSDSLSIERLLQGS